MTISAELETYLIELAFDMKQEGNELERTASRWILSHLRRDMATQRKRTPRKLKAMLPNVRGGAFDINAADLKRLQEEE